MPTPSIDRLMAVWPAVAARPPLDDAELGDALKLVAGVCLGQRAHPNPEPVAVVQASAQGAVRLAAQLGPNAIDLDLPAFEVDGTACGPTYLKILQQATPAGAATAANAAVSLIAWSRTQPGGGGHPEQGQALAAGASDAQRRRSCETAARVLATLPISGADAAQLGAAARPHVAALAGRRDRFTAMTLMAYLTSAVAAGPYLSDDPGFRVTIDDMQTRELALGSWRLEGIDYGAGLDLPRDAAAGQSVTAGAPCPFPRSLVRRLDPAEEAGTPA